MRLLPGAREGNHWHDLKDLCLKVAQAKGKTWS
jgi:hypothetical protein